MRRSTKSLRRLIVEILALVVMAVADPPHLPLATMERARERGWLEGETEGKPLM